MTEQRPFTVAAFNAYLSEKKLMASQCLECDEAFIPPRAICPHCYTDKLKWVELSGKGKLAAFTAISIAPTMMIEQGYGRDKPYVTGIVELDEGAKISARITGVDASNPESIMIGTPVTLDFVVHGEGDNQKTFLAFK